MRLSGHGPGFCSSETLPGEHGVRRLISPEEKPVFCSEGEMCAFQRNGVKRLFLSRLGGFILMLRFADEENQVQRACAVLKVAGLSGPGRIRPGLGSRWVWTQISLRHLPGRAHLLLLG